MANSLPPEAPEERSMSALDATVWTIGSLLGLFLAASLVNKLWPAALRDRGATAAIQFVVYTILILLVRWVYFPKGNARTVLGLTSTRWFFYPMGLLLGAAIQLPASGLYDAISARWPVESPSAEFSQIFTTLPMWRKVAAGVGLIGTTPLVEELFFRGALFGTLKRRHSVVSVVIATSVLFAFVHTQPQLYLPIAMVGAALAFLRVASGSVLPGLFMHAGFNGVTFWAIASGFSETPEATEPTPVKLVIIGTVVSAGLLALADYFRPRTAPKENDGEESPL